MNNWQELLARCCGPAGRGFFRHSSQKKDTLNLLNQLSNEGVRFHEMERELRTCLNEVKSKSPTMSKDLNIAEEIEHARRIFEPFLD